MLNFKILLFGVEFIGEQCKFTWTVYHIPIFSAIYINFDRFLSSSYKTGMIHFLFRRTCYPRDIKMLVWVQSRQTNHMGRKGASLALAGHTSSDVVTIKIPYGVDNLLHRPAVHPFFSYWVGQNWIWILSVEIGLRRLPVVLAVISVDAYSFLVFSDLTRRLEDAGIGVFWLLPNLEAATKRFLHQQVNIPG